MKGNNWPAGRHLNFVGATQHLVSKTFNTSCLPKTVMRAARRQAKGSKLTSSSKAFGTMRSPTLEATLNHAVLTLVGKKNDA